MWHLLLNKLSEDTQDVEDRNHRSGDPADSQWGIEEDEANKESDGAADEFRDI